MNGIKYAFGFILLAVAVYLATPHLPYFAVVSLYTLLMIVPALMLLAKSGKQRPSENGCRRIGLFTADWRLMVWLAKPQ